MTVITVRPAGATGSSTRSADRDIDFIPWTQDAFVERSVVREGYLQRQQAPGASTAIAPKARRDWQVRGVGALRAR
jgi:hypothetical protein